jgi:hypothetical protein
MKPRMTYYGPLDEIEAEMGPRPFSLWEQVALLNRTMGKERTLKIGDKVKVDGKTVEVSQKCIAFEGRWHVKYGVDLTPCCVAELQCIPVEPERVKWYYRMSCATRSCAANDEGMCNVSINGLATCSKHQWPKPSPGLLQRMGMATWEEEEKDWFVVGKARNDGHPMAPDDGLTHIVAMPLNDDTIIAIDPDDWETRYRQLLKITNRLLDERYGEGGK